MLMTPEEKIYSVWQNVLGYAVRMRRPTFVSSLKTILVEHHDFSVNNLPLILRRKNREFFLFQKYPQLFVVHVADPVECHPDFDTVTGSGLGDAYWLQVEMVPVVDMLPEVVHKLDDLAQLKDRFTLRPDSFDAIMVSVDAKYWQADLYQILHKIGLFGHVFIVYGPDLMNPFPKDVFLHYVQRLDHSAVGWHVIVIKIASLHHEVNFGLICDVKYLIHCIE